ncbi:diguanylate cyclase [Legionella dresdenensis]|uniref:diguanylate cyclase n=1 Tax=Legionella dresdenensis TaxID=450200 RepID=A0ABV8CFR5_9GAMM
MLLLKELSSSLQTCLYIEEAYQLIRQYTEQLLPGVGGVLYLMHPSRNYLEAMSTWGALQSIEKIIKPDECFALRRGTVYKVFGSNRGLICHHKSKENCRPYICMPLYAQSDILGLLYLELENDNPELLESKNDLLYEMISEQIALGLSNIRLREALSIQSFRDALTGLYNRRYLGETLERELSRCARNSASLALLMIDIDHFKSFNDRFGHEAGDMVLQAFANTLKNFIRKADIACRYGGEEFIVILPEIELDAIERRTNELHKAVSEIHVRYGGNALPTITISIGVVIYPQHGKTINELINGSDLALYEAKNTGRNKTVVYTPPND